MITLIELEGVYWSEQSKFPLWLVTGLTEWTFWSLNWSWLQLMGRSGILLQMSQFSILNCWTISNSLNHTVWCKQYKNWLKQCNEGRFKLWTMEDGLFPWSNFLKEQFTKSLGPSLGANWMWTKRNDHAPKVNVLIFFYMCFKKGSFEKSSSLTIVLSSCLHLLFHLRGGGPLMLVVRREL